jgi:ferric-dicitrate binding protein FerR (iron transport regulator)
LKTEPTYKLTDDALEGLSDAQKRVAQETWEWCGQFVPVVMSDDASVLKARLMSQIRVETSAATGSYDRPALRLLRGPSILRSTTFRVMASAAAVLIAVAMVLSPRGTHYRAAPGSTAQHIQLSDGSSVLLAAGSRLTTSNSFGEADRQVILRGEAFFDVAKGVLPFEVQTRDARTTVLGTSFNVRSWPGSLSGLTQVIVETGRVAVSVGDLETVVEPGQALTTSSEILTPVETDPEFRLAWRSGGFSYENELIGTVIDDVERRFDVRIKAPASIRLRPITIHRNEVSDAAEFIGDIAATISVRYRATANGLEMYLD